MARDIQAVNSVFGQALQDAGLVNDWRRVLSAELTLSGVGVPRLVVEYLVTEEDARVVGDAVRKTVFEAVHVTDSAFRKTGEAATNGAVDL